MSGNHNQNQLNGGSNASIGRIVSVTGSKAIVLLDGAGELRARSPDGRPEMGTLLAIETTRTTVLAIVSALSVPVPSQREGDSEVWIAELGMVGELTNVGEGKPPKFNRGVTGYPGLGDRVRLALRTELEATFCGDSEAMVRVGSIRQDSSIPAMVRVDELLGKHFAILGTTGTGKSCTTALILRSIVEKNPNAHIVLLDPHNEYATAFSEWAEVISPRNMQLPYWLLTFEEIQEVLVGDGDRKAEIEILQEVIPIAKARYNSSRSSEPAKLRRGFGDASRFTVDTPVPYRISDLLLLIDERLGKLENRKDLAPYRILKHRIETISQDGRYAFMFGSLTVYDGMTQVLGRIFRVPVNSKPITILELTGIPSEVVNVVVSVLCRMTFDFALWSEGQVPVTLVCEEAHRYVPVNSTLGFEPCKRAIAKIAKEGRKYGASLCIVTQRPAEIDPTILSQCNTVFALRMSNDRDQEIVQSAVADTGAGLLEFLPSLGQREAIAFGDGMALPVRIKFDELPKRALPKSSSANFSERWQTSLGDEGFLDQIVERWRSSGIPATGDGPHHLAMMADALGLHAHAHGHAQSHPAESDVREQPLPHTGTSSVSPPRSSAPLPRREAPPPLPSGNVPGSQQGSKPSTSAESLRSLRERLTRPLG
ncbi:DUF87 domain-containing protein [Hyphomicrobium sp.]|uniref:ATP-binding protein n=1 Tax=Hyphomicrobium sp. TaxID=82 RepID=UPI000F9DCB30|nr:DUF87 domain-containing protein [Hyphomicrobium sp.]RUP08196.1 MAG: DUF87 domain-containing protein [Hyphomicrobium sp.]